MRQGGRPIFRQSYRRRSDDDARILPLINVVFLLLVFFMVAGHIAASDLFPVHPPSSESGKPSVTSDVTILLGADGRLAVDGVAVATADLAAAVTAVLASSPDVAVRLKADAAVEAIQAVRVLDELRLAGVKRVQMLTQARR